MCYYNAYSEHVELKEGLASFTETIIQKLETSAKEWGNGEEMRTGEKYWGAVNDTIFLRTETKTKKNKENKQGESHLGLETRKKKCVGSGL